MTSSDSAGYYLQSSSPLDSALFFVLAAFILNVIVVIIAFCYFDPDPYATPVINRTYHAIRRISARPMRSNRNGSAAQLHSIDKINNQGTYDSPSASTVLFV